MLKPRCPVCGDNTNSLGQPFGSEWAVACHVAGKINYSSDKLHRAWARQKAPGVNLSLSVPKLADELVWVIHQEIEASQSSREPSPPTPLSRIHDIEVTLHRYVRQRLRSHFGTQNDSWWVEGIPLPIRQECAQRREADAAREEPYAYTYLIDLKSILEKNWSLFGSGFLRVRGTVTSKKDFLDYLLRLNEARNRYSHPVRAPEPGSKAFEVDLTLAQSVADMIDEFCKS